MKRRAFVSGTAASTLLASCDWQSLSRQSHITGGFVGAHHERGHAFRDDLLPHTPVAEKRTAVAIVGAGISGLAVARQLRKAGITDYRLFELEDAAGGNSRAHSIEGMACPLGAHYLPTPDARNAALNELLQELQLLHVENHERRFNERHLCHSPQERLLLLHDKQPQWQDGLLPILQPDTNESPNKIWAIFANEVGVYVNKGIFAMPTQAAAWSPQTEGLDQQSFAQWLQSKGLYQDAALNWYLDYCCRDDYGAGVHEVSAWAGLHYFASRHGFNAPSMRTEQPPPLPSPAGGGGGNALRDENDGVLTWPEGNAWLAQRLAAPHATHTQTASLVTSVVPGRSQVRVQVWNAREAQRESWRAEQLVLCTPLFISSRIMAEYASNHLKLLSQSIHYSPWVVANVHVPEPLGEWQGVPRAWDNVMYLPGKVSPQNLGYVDAMHQSTRPTPPSAGPSILTCYYAYGTAPQQRKALLARSWKDQCEIVLNDLSLAHPEIRDKAKHIDIMRYGHAMTVPTPGLRSSVALAAFQAPSKSRIHFAHSDLSAYSVFEEAFYWGTRVGRHVAALVNARSAS